MTLGGGGRTGVKEVTEAGVHGSSRTGQQEREEGRGRRWNSSIRVAANHERG